jgi:hypothetical protein
MTLEDLDILDKMLTRLRAHGYVVQTLDFGTEGVRMELAASPEADEARSHKGQSRSERTLDLSRVPT